MAFKLSKDQIKKKAAFVTRLNDAATNIEDAVREYNAVVIEAEGFRNDIVNEWDDAISEKSEKWQEGDAGQLAVDLKDAWEGADFDEIDQPGNPVATVLEELPDEAG